MHPCKTPHAEVNAVLRELLPGLHAILGDQFVGMYLTGSLAAGDFDRNSDVDFAVVTEDEMGGELFSALDALHRRVAATDEHLQMRPQGNRANVLGSELTAHS